MDYTRTRLEAITTNRPDDRWDAYAAIHAIRHRRARQIALAILQEEANDWRQECQLYPR
jgi:hypothetical protein